MLWWNKLSHCFVQNKKLHLSFFVDPKSLILELILDPIPFFWRTIMYAIIKHLIETAYLYHNLCTYKNVPEKRHWCSSELWWCIIKTQKRVDDTFSFVTLYGWTNTMKTFHYQLLRKYDTTHSYIEYMKRISFHLKTAVHVDEERNDKWRGSWPPTPPNKQISQITPTTGSDFSDTTNHFMMKHIVMLFSFKNHNLSLCFIFRFEVSHFGAKFVTTSVLLLTITYIIIKHFIAASCMYHNTP